jgi:Uma2 family endonuclease
VSVPTTTGAEDRAVGDRPDRSPSSGVIEAAPRVYDRSSLTGDFMVMIADQTPEDFERYAPESRYCEYINGIVYMPSPVSDRHQEQVGFLFHLLDGFRCERGLGPVLMGPAVLRLSADWKPEPDISVCPGDGVGQPRPPALLVIEILSPSTRDHDLGLKLTIYRAAGIPEVWLCDEPHRTVIVERRVGEGYQREQRTEGRLDSTAIPGFWIDVAWLWAHPLPNARRCLEAILAGPPACPEGVAPRK